MAALTKAEASIRAGLLEVESYDIFLDLTADPVRSRTEIRFRCGQPGAATTAEVALPVIHSVVLNGQPLGPPRNGRLAVPGLAAQNVLTVDGEVAWSRAGSGLTRCTDPTDGSVYLIVTCYPTSAPEVFCCFDQPDLGATITLSAAAPAGWECVANSPFTQRPEPGQAGLWRFAAVPAMRPFELSVCAGPYVTDAQADAGTAGTAVALTVRRRRSLDGTDGVAALARFADTARQALDWYEQVLGVACPYPGYDIVFVPELIAYAESIPGLMLVTESLLNRMSDPDDDFVAMICAHEVAHLWFGCHVGQRWWDDVWLDEAMATYLSYTAEVDALTAAQPWTAFGYRSKQDAYEADELPSRLPVSSQVDSAADALAKPRALIYFKGASVIRQLGALIGRDALHAGLRDYQTRFGQGTAAMDDIVACWSRAAGRDLAGWAEQWLRTVGASTLRPELTLAADGTIAAAAVLQDSPRTHRIRVGLYDLDGGQLRRRDVLDAEINGARTPLPALTGAAAPDALVLNDGDLTYARIRFDERTHATLARVAMDVGDPLTEAVCWNAAWHQLIDGQFAAAQYAALVAARLARPTPLPRAAVEVLLERAILAADIWAQSGLRARLREQTADAALAAARQARPGSPVRRALVAGYVASAHSQAQLGLLRAWLTGTSLPDDGPLSTDLRGRILFTLAARGLASDDELDAMAARDPVRGPQNRAICRALRPDPAAKQAAWAQALDAGQDWQLSAAAARGIWVPGQEDVTGGLLDRYVTEALPALAGRDSETAEELVRLLYPATLVSADTLAAVEAALDTSGLGHRMRAIVLDQQAILRSVLAARRAQAG